MIEKGKKVSLEYSVYLEDGTLVDTNVGEQPLQYMQGQKQIAPALEDELEGMKVGEEKRVTLSPEKAYGDVDPEAFQEVDKEMIPENLRQEGAILGVQDQSGNTFRIRVHKIQDEKIIVDFNHPLAGHTLTFNVKVVEVE